MGNHWQHYSYIYLEWKPRLHNSCVLRRALLLEVLLRHNTAPCSALTKSYSKSLSSATKGHRPCIIQNILKMACSKTRRRWNHDSLFSACSKNVATALSLLRMTWHKARRLKGTRHFYWWIQHALPFFRTSISCEARNSLSHLKLLITSDSFCIVQRATAQY
jgi:hypothetical protein